MSSGTNNVIMVKHFIDEKSDDYYNYNHQKCFDVIIIYFNIYWSRDMNLFCGFDQFKEASHLINVLQHVAVFEGCIYISY